MLCCIASALLSAPASFFSSGAISAACCPNDCPTSAAKSSSMLSTMACCAASAALAICTVGGSFAGMGKESIVGRSWLLGEEHAFALGGKGHVPVVQLLLLIDRQAKLLQRVQQALRTVATG